uniref:RING-type domain-containing protein n=1 Tax=Peronospora matthiolae TaxID=2874970 RepID=A0AAV1VIJ4_9STRA
MVFISLQDVVSEGNAVGVNMKQIAKPAATIRVVVTPGCPTKQLDTPFARGSLFYVSTRRRTPSSLVLYVSISAVRHKWVLHKTSDDFTHVREDIRRVGNGCKGSACCGHVQRLLKTSLDVGTRRRREPSAGLQYDQCHVFQAYANGLVQVVLGVGHGLQCHTMQRIRHILEEFLDIASHCTHAFDRVLCDDDPVATTPMLVSKQPSLQTGVGCGDGSGDSCECPICCGNLADDKTRRLLCGHNYHAGCLQVWLNLQPTCPVCGVHLGKEVEPE